MSRYQHGIRSACIRRNIEECQNTTFIAIEDDKQKKPCEKSLRVFSKYGGGADGTRTRDPRRDRPVF
ncbi:protein of unknown function [Xenorhabdus poinarii G6]|uniref:Uncharacterized protein n=1 Tax=Xenorhabdus poinarii G6 TaxID=1354304 RepID=A0A068R8H5_9GAMM|nr:protein of unknown function [Xenorhabdus poinarii G6]